MAGPVYGFFRIAFFKLERTDFLDNKSINKSEKKERHSLSRRLNLFSRDI